MRKWALTGALALGVAVTGLTQASAPSRDPVDTIYDLYLGGIKAGELEMAAEYVGDRYEARSVLRTAGLVGLVYEASFQAQTQGRLEEGTLAPDRFAADSRMKSKHQYVEMIYGSGAPQEVRAKPAFVPKPWQVDPAQQTGALDPISAALYALAPAPVAEICNQTVEVFDGRRRYAVDLGAPEPHGERLRCRATYRRIAGFKPKMMKKPAFPFAIWWEERPDGLAHVVRAAGESMFGIAAVVLRK